MNQPAGTVDLRLGPDVVKLLVPQRRPFLLLDLIEAFAATPRPWLVAARHISCNEWVFAGHFPDLQLWPGSLTIEGLGQACNALYTLVGIRRLWQDHGGDPDDVLAGLRNLELGYRLQPGFRPEASRKLLDVLRLPGRLLGFTAAVDVKLTAPVFPGQRLDYSVAQAHEVGDLVRFEVEASVQGREVARGTMTSRCRGFTLPDADTLGSRPG